MATYVLIHGASSDSWYWSRVVPLLRARGHEVVAPDLPCDDDSAGLEQYADTVVRAIGDRKDLIVVAQSLAGFTAPLVCVRVSVRLMILVAAMIPKPGETGEQWWRDTGHEEAWRADQRRRRRPPKAPFDPEYFFFHDVPRKVKEEAFRRGERAQSGTPMQEPSPLREWPDVPTRFLLCRQDRFFPAPFMRRLVKERLGIKPDEMDSGHLPALAHPRALVTRLEKYRLGLRKARR